MFFDWIRRTGFWALDALRGGDVRRNYLEIKDMMQSQKLNEEQLQKLLKHAVDTTAFYSKFSGLGFENFPVINKNTIKEQWDLLYSNLYKDKPIHEMSTSGSTGTPFTMHWNMEKRKRQLAELIYFNEQAGQKLGQRYIYFRVWTDKNRKSKLELWMQNLLPVNILHLNDETLENICQILKKRPYVNSCLAYGSTYEYLVKYIQSKNYTPKDFRVKTFVSGSEVLSMEMKQKIKESVGCKIIDRYSNEENGFLAQSGDLSDEFKVNTSGFLIEILKQDSDLPADIGEVGRVVVTDLYSFAVPLIRYDTGDLAIVSSRNGNWVTGIKTIQGRKVDVIYDTSGNRLTAHTWSVYMWKFEKLKQYQFVQKTAKDYVLKVNGAKEYYKDEEFVELLKSILGSDANITIEHVFGIPALASGKFKKTVCEYQYNPDDYSESNL